MYIKSVYIGCIVGIINLIPLCITMKSATDPSVFEYYDLLQAITFFLIVLSLLVGIYFAINHTKKHLNSDISFKQALLTGIVVSVIAGCVGLITNYIAYQIFMTPEIIEALMKGYKEEKIALGVSHADIDGEIEMISGPMGVWICGCMYMTDF